MVVLCIQEIVLCRWHVDLESLPLEKTLDNKVLYLIKSVVYKKKYFQVYLLRSGFKK